MSFLFRIASTWIFLALGAGAPSAWAKGDTGTHSGLPPAPQLLLPRPGATVLLLNIADRVVLRWAGSKGASAYHVEVRNGKGPVYSSRVADNEVSLKLPAGSYRWIVRALLDSGEGGEGSAGSSFVVRYGKLAAPEIPDAPASQMDEGRMRLEWSRVDGAEAYEIRIFPRGEDGDLPETKRLIVPSNSVVVDTLAPGEYSWSVRALARLGANRRPAASSEVSQGGFVFDPPVGQHWGRLSFSTILAPYVYRASNPSIGPGGLPDTAPPLASTVQLGLEVPFHPRWAIGFEAGETFSTIGSGSFGEVRFGLQGRYRAPLGAAWFLTPRGGLEVQQYLEGHAVTPRVLDPTSPHVTALGPGIGFALEKDFSPSFDVIYFADYLVPLTILGSQFSGSTITSTYSYQNLLMGLQGTYWLTSHFGFGVGMSWRNNAISFRRTDGVHEIQTHGLGGTAALVYGL